MEISTTGGRRQKLKWVKSYVLEEPEIKWSKILREAKCEKNKVVESRGYEIFREVVYGIAKTYSTRI